MEAVAFGGRDTSRSTAVNDWTNVQFEKRQDISNKVYYPYKALSIDIKCLIDICNIL